jgi:hypothetical protein
MLGDRALYRTNASSLHLLPRVQDVVNAIMLSTDLYNSLLKLIRDRTCNRMLSTVSPGPPRVLAFRPYMQLTIASHR